MTDNVLIELVKKAPFLGIILTEEYNEEVMTAMRASTTTDWKELETFLFSSRPGNTAITIYSLMKNKYVQMTRENAIIQRLNELEAKLNSFKK